MRVFGDELFSGPGCGYNIHRHHNFIICAFVLKGQLTHVNTVGNIDQLSPGDYYAFSAGSGGKHCELNLRNEDTNILYMWIMPNQLLSRHRMGAAISMPSQTATGWCHWLGMSTELYACLRT